MENNTYENIKRNGKAWHLLPLKMLLRICGNAISDKTFLKWKYRIMMRKKLDLKNPCTFTEKLQWLKLYNRKPEYTMMVDKYLVRQYIAEQLGEEYLIPLLGVWDSPNNIDFDALPDRFVLKCNHNSGLGMCICKDKSKLDINKVKEELRKGIKQDYYKSLREWPYKNVPRKIICEQYMEDERCDELNDYKFYCFNGEPRIVMYSSGRFSGNLCFDYYNMSWEKLPLVWDKPNSNKEHAKPVCFEEMKQMVAKLCKDIPHVRVDMYSIKNSPYFGELTFFDSSGFCHFEPEEWNEKLGDIIQLPPRYDNE